MQGGPAVSRIGKQNVGSRSTRVTTHIGTHAGIVILRRLLLFGIRRTSLAARDRRAMLQVRQRLFVHVVRVGCLSEHLDVDLRVRVLDDGAEVAVRCIILLRSPRYLACE